MLDKRFSWIAVLQRVPRLAWALAALALAVRLAWLVAEGPRIATDTSFYVRVAREFVEEGPFASPLFAEGYVLYTAFGFFLAALHVLVGDHMVLAWIVLQIVAVSFATVPLYLLGRQMGGPAVGALAALIHATLFESFQWDVYALSDAMFQAAVITEAFLVVQAAGVGSPAWRCLAFAGGLGVLFLRPVGIVFVGVMGAWLLLAHGSPREHLRSLLVSRRRALLSGAAAVLLVVGLAATLAPYIDHEAGKYTRYYSLGLVVHDDPSLAYRYEPAPYQEDSLLGFVAANPVPFFVITVERLWAFWTVNLHRFSTVHNVVNAVTLYPLFGAGFFTAAYVALWKRRAALLLLPVVLIAGLTMFHSLTLIDYDFRYRDPLLPFMGLLAAYGGRLAWLRLGLSPPRVWMRLRVAA